VRTHAACAGIVLHPWGLMMKGVINGRVVGYIFDGTVH